MKNIVKPLLVLFALATLASCASSANEDLEEVRFALDSGNYEAAVTKATSVFDGDRTNTEAALLLSSAYAGRAGIRILAVTADISDTSNASDEFDAVHDALVADLVAGTGLADLRLAIAVLRDQLTPQPESTHALYRDQQFQMGMLEAIEAFGSPSLTAQPTAAGDVTQTEISDKGDVQEDFIAVDDHLINSGMEASDDIIVNLRKNYCVLQSASAAASGFDLVALRDLTACQLNTDTTGIVFESTATSCATFDTAFTACASAGDTEL